MRSLNPIIHNLDVLRSPNSQVERLEAVDPIRPVEGPLLAPGCDSVCDRCHESLLKNKMPLFSLANGMWVGEVPEVLTSLSFAEKLLIARVRHNL